MTASAPGRVDGEVLIGLGLMVVAMLIVPSLDACAKLLSARLPALEVALARFAMQALLMGGYAVIVGRARDLWPGQLWGQFLRGLALAVTSLAFFAGLSAMPMADCIAITFVEPILLTGLSAVFLKEPVGLRRWVACGVGLVGGLIIVRPSFAIFGLHALYPLGAALSFAIYHLLTRHLAGQATVIGAQFLTGVSGTLVLAPSLAVASWFGLAGQDFVMPVAGELELMLLIGLISVVAHTLVLQAYDRAPATVLAPFGYLEIVSATILGYLIFGDFPGWPTWVGVALIVGSGLYTILREHQLMQPIEPGS